MTAGKVKMNHVVMFDYCDFFLSKQRLQDNSNEGHNPKWSFGLHKFLAPLKIVVKVL